MNSIPLLIWISFLGLSFGSFVNALVWRVKHNKNFVSERSMCVHCKHELAWYDLVPVFSWLQLRGKCRYCKRAIDDSPIVEVATMALFAISYWWWPGDLSVTQDYILLGFWLVQLVGLVALTVYDIRWMLLPNKILFPMTGLAVVQRIYEAVVVTKDWIPLQEMMLGMLVGGGLFYALFQVSKGRWIGGGDVKLGFYMGALLNPVTTGIALLLGFYSAAIYIFPLMLAKKVTRKSLIPFGPFLILGLFLMQIFCSQITDWVQGLYGL